MPAADLSTARRWMTPALANTMWAEVHNERDGGASPATLASTIDSISQNPDAFHLQAQDYLALLVIVGILNLDMPVAVLLYQPATQEA